MLSLLPPTRYTVITTSSLSFSKLSPYYYHLKIILSVYNPHSKIILSVYNSPFQNYTLSIQPPLKN